MLKEIIQDFTALGGLAVFLVAIFILYFAGRQIPALKLLIALILCYVVVLGIRVFYFKQRPDKQKYSGFLQKLDASSFPSLHSARIAALSILLVFFFESVFVKVGLLFLIPLVALTRIWLKRHYIVDAVAGIVVGLLIGFGVEYFL